MNYTNNATPLMEMSSMELPKSVAKTCVRGYDLKELRGRESFSDGVMFKQKLEG